MADWEDAPSSPPSSSGWEDAPTSKAPNEKKEVTKPSRPFSIGQTALDIADVVASTPAFLAGAGTGLVAAEVHAADPRKPAGTHFGAGLEVAGAVAEAGGSPLRKALTAAGIVDKPKAGAEGTSVVSDVMGVVGQKIEEASQAVLKKTGSQEAADAVKFGLSYIAPEAVGGAVGGLAKKIKLVQKTSDIARRDTKLDAYKAEEDLVKEAPPKATPEDIQWEAPPKSTLERQPEPFKDPHIPPKGMDYSAFAAEYRSQHLGEKFKRQDVEAAWKAHKAGEEQTRSGLPKEAEVDLAHEQKAYEEGVIDDSSKPPPYHGMAKGNKSQSGQADPELLTMLGLGTVGATAAAALLGEGDDDTGSMTGRAILGFGLGAILAKAPSAYRGVKTLPKAEFIDRVVSEKGPEYAKAAERLWKETTPKGWEEQGYGKRASERYLVNQAILQKGYELDGARKAAMLMALKLRPALSEKGLTPAVAKLFWEREAGKALSPEHEKLYQEHYKPLVEDIGNILKEAAVLSGKHVKELEVDFHPRTALEHRNAFQKIIEGDGIFLGGKPSSAFGRTLFAVDTPKGPLIVHIGEKGALQGWKDGKPLDLGFAKGTPKLGEALVEGDMSMGPLREAGKLEVEANSPTRYWNDPVETAIIKRAEAQAYLDQLKFYDGIKNHPEFKEQIADKRESAPSNWKPVASDVLKRLPMFRDYHFNPRMKEAIEDLAGHRVELPGREILAAVTNVATKNLLINPLPHIDNEIVHFLVASGAKGVINMATHPFGTIDNIKAALSSVRAQDGLQMELMKSGMSTMYTDRYINKHIQNLTESYIAAAEKTKSLDQLALHLGMKPLEFYQALSNKTGDFMWMARDTMVTSLAQSKMRDGLSMKEAVRQTMMDMPSYRLPPRVGEEIISAALQPLNMIKQGMAEDIAAGTSRAISFAGSSQLSSAFFRYHYAVLSEMGNIIKDVAVGDGKSKLHALDKAAALLAIQIGYNTVGDAFAQWATGNEEARLRRAGPLHMIEKGKDVLEGKPNSGLYLALSIFTPPMVTPLFEAAYGKTLTGKDVRHSEDPASVQIADTASHIAKGLLPQSGSLMPSSQDTDIQGGVAKLFDIESPSPEKVAARQQATKRAEATADTRAAQRAVGRLGSLSKEERKALTNVYKRKFKANRMQGE